MLLLTVLLAALPAVDTLSLPWPPTLPVRPAVVAVQRQPAVPIVALRLSLAAEDPPGYAGAGHLIQHLAFPTLRDRVARVGGRATMERTSDALVYTVSGPSAELEHLATALLGTLVAPRATRGEFLPARRQLDEERLAEWETAPQHVRAVLRQRLFPEDLSAAGTEASGPALQLERIPDLWAHMYRPERVAVIAVGDVTTERVERAFSVLPAARAASTLPLGRDTVSRAAAARAETTRGWHARAYDAEGADPVAVSVIAHLLGRELSSRLPGAEFQVEHWWTHHGQALALIGAAPDSLLEPTRRALDEALPTLRRSLGAGMVRTAARDLRREMLFYVRSPERMAAVLGRFTDREGDSRAAQRFYEELSEVGETRVREALVTLAARTPASVSLPPQRPVTP